MNIEEVAFKDRAELAHLNGIDLLNIIEFLQKDRQQWINQFTQTHNESVDIRKENQELKEKLLVTLTNEETFRLEMEDITKILGLDEDTLFDDVKAYARSLKDNWNKLKEFMKKEYDYLDKYSTPAYGCAMGEINRIKNKIQEMEKSDSNE